MNKDILIDGGDSFNIPKPYTNKELQKAISESNINKSLKIN